MPVGILASTIEIGDHWMPFSSSVNMDDVLATVVAGLLVIAVGLLLRARLTSEVPGRLQTIYEGVMEAVTRQATGTVGDKAVPFIPLVVSLFFFILFCNWLEMIPSQPHHPGLQYLPAPTGDVNLCYALALTVIVTVHVSSIRAKGFRGYVGHYFEPFPVLFPINLIEEIAKPVTLALRLFGNIFAGGLMLLLFTGLFTAFIVPFPDLVWKIFDGLFVGPIQAFIFSLLTILYLESGLVTTHA